MIHPMDIPPEVPLDEVTMRRIERMLEDPEFVAGVVRVVYDSGLMIRGRHGDEELRSSAEDGDNISAPLVPLRTENTTDAQ